MKTKVIGAITDVSHISWQQLMEISIRKMLADEKTVGRLDPDHIRDTPCRVVKAYEEYMSGVKQDPKLILKTTFPSDGSHGMVVVESIMVNSLCQHHLVPFIGEAWFGYIPGKKLVGLSKIARLVDCFAHRPQIQEDLCKEIVEAFDEIIQPIGCGIVMRASHMCMSIRGVKKHGAKTRTIRLAGTFLHNPSVKQEFLEAIR